MMKRTVLAGAAFSVMACWTGTVTGERIRQANRDSMDSRQIAETVGAKVAAPDRYERGERAYRAGREAEEKGRARLAYKAFLKAKGFYDAAYATTVEKMKEAGKEILKAERHLALSSEGHRWDEIFSLAKKSMGTGEYDKAYAYAREINEEFP